MFQSYVQVARDPVTRVVFLVIQCIVQYCHIMKEQADFVQDLCEVQ